MVSDCRYFKVNHKLAKEYNIRTTYINSDKFLASLLLEMYKIAESSSPRDVRKVLKVPKDILERMNEYCNKYSMSVTDLVNLSLSLILRKTEEISMLIYTKYEANELRLSRDNNAQICFKISESDYEKLREISREKDISIRTFFLFALIKTIGAADEIFSPDEDEVI